MSNSNVFAQRVLTVGLSATALGVLDGGGSRKPQSVVVDVDLPQGLNSLDTVFPKELPAGFRGRFVRRRMDWVFADEVTRYFLVTPPKGIERLSDCTAAAHMRFERLFDEPVDGWRVAFRAHPHRPFLCVALPRPTLEQAALIAQQHGLWIGRMVPASVASINRWRRQLPHEGWFGVLYPDGITLSLIERGQLVSIRCHRISAELTELNWLHDLVRKEALLLDRAPPLQIHLCVDGVGQRHAGSSLSIAVVLLDDRAPGRSTARPSSQLRHAPDGSATTALQLAMRWAA